jgi:hypothetical protein
MTMPGFSGEASLYKMAIGYRLATMWGKGVQTHLGPAQFLRPPGDGLGCTIGPVDVSICRTGCARTCVTPDEDITTCLPSERCGIPPLQCGDCLLPTDNIRQKVLTGQPIDPATDLVFKQTCTQGANTFEQNCTKCGQEFRISLPWPASDKCIQLCMSGFDPSLFNLSARDC